MPASMINAPTGGRPKVIGSNIAMVATVPMPGRTPTRVPTSAPSRQNRMLYGLAATWKPIQRFARSSDMMTHPHSEEARPELERQFEQNHEQQPAERRHCRSRDQALDPAHLGRTEDGDHECKKGRRQQAELREHHVSAEQCKGSAANHGRERQNRNDDERWSADLVFLDGRSVGDQTDQRDRGSERGEQSREQPRRGAGTEGEPPLAGQVARSPDRHDGEPDENHPAPKIARIPDSKGKAWPLSRRADALRHVPSLTPRTL